MKLTQETDYAIRIVVNLAEAGGKRSAGEISELIAVTPRFTLKILRKLIQAGFARSYKGVTGGYELTKEARDITMLDVVEAIDGKVSINRCINCNEKCTRVGDPENCKTHAELKRINEILKTELRQVSIDKLV